MRYFGDLTEDQILDFTFSTNGADGAPITLGDTPALRVYKADSDAESTAGITLTVDFDGVTGLHHVRVDTSAHAFYEVGKDYSVVIQAGTVDGISVVGRTLGTFSIQNRFGANLGQLESDMSDVKTAVETDLPATLTSIEGKEDTIISNQGNHDDRFDDLDNGITSLAGSVEANFDLLNTIIERIGRLLGLSYENAKLTDTVWTTINSKQCMTSGKLRCWDTRANAIAAGATGLIATWQITATYDVDGDLATHLMTLEP